MAIPNSYLSKLSLVLMKKSNFCFAYSITSEWSSTPWLTPKGPENLKEQATGNANRQHKMQQNNTVLVTSCIRLLPKWQPVSACVESDILLIQWEVQPYTEFLTVNQGVLHHPLWIFSLNYTGKSTVRGKHWQWRNTVPLKLITWEKL